MNASRKPPDTGWRNLTVRTTDALGLAIVSGNLEPGSILDRSALPAELEEISRTVFREAISQLTSLGLLRPVKRLGTLVLGEDEWTILNPRVMGWIVETGSASTVLAEVSRFREIVEPAAAHAAARFRTPAQLEALYTALANLEALAESKSDDPELDIRFHLALIDAADNRLFADLKPSVEHALRASLSVTLVDEQSRREALEWHRAVVEAVADRAPDAAQKAMQTIIENTYRPWSSDSLGGDPQ